MNRFNETIDYTQESKSRNIAFLLTRFGNYCSFYGNGYAIDVLRFEIGEHKAVLEATITENVLNIGD